MPREPLHASSSVWLCTPHDRVVVPKIGSMPLPRSHLPSAAAPGAGLEDLAATWVVPHLCLAPRLAATPSHLILGTLAMLGVGLAQRLPSWFGLQPTDTADPLTLWLSRCAEHAHVFYQSALRLDSDGMATSAGGLAGGALASVVREGPLAALLTFTLSALVAALCYHSISRGAAVAMAVGQRSGSFITLLRGSARQWPSLLGVVVVPWLLAPLLALLIQGLGYILLRVPYVNILGAGLLGANVLLSIVVIALSWVALLGSPLFIPALAAESSDGIDAIQRVYAYVVRGFVRLLYYILIVAVLGFIMIGLAFVLAHMSGGAARILTLTWLPVESREMVTGTLPGALWHQRAVADIFAWWVSVPVLLASGYAFSYVACAATLCYLGIRQRVDGQDMREIWDPADLQTPRELAKAKARSEELAREVRSEPED